MMCVNVYCSVSRERDVLCCHRLSWSGRADPLLSILTVGAEEEKGLVSHNYRCGLPLMYSMHVEELMQS